MHTIKNKLDNIRYKKEFFLKKNVIYITITNGYNAFIIVTSIIYHNNIFCISSDLDSNSSIILLESIN